MRPEDMERLERLFPVGLRKRMHEQGLVDIHQSGLSTWRECHAKLGFEISSKVVKHDAPLLLGGVMHEGLADHLLKEDGGDPDYWIEVFDRVKERDQKRAAGKEIVYHLNGNLLTKRDIIRWCTDFVSAYKTGILLWKLLVEVKDEIEQRGFMIVHQEFPLSFKVGSPYPLRFTGTLDLVLLDEQGREGIADFKMSGLIQAYTRGEAPNKVSYSKPEIMFHSQLRHYHWMYRLVAPQSQPKFYGVVAPANRIRYKIGEKKGEPKGSCLFFADAMAETFVRDYENQVAEQVKLISNGVFTKLMPTSFGKPACPDCRYFNSCMNDPTASSLANASELDFLRQ